MPSDVLGEALAALHHHRGVVPELLLRMVGVMRARTADIGRMLCVALDVASSLSVMFPTWFHPVRDRQTLFL